MTGKRQLEAQALEKIAAFEIMLTAIRAAGLNGNDPLEGFLLFDLDGNLWHKQPWEIDPDDIIEFVQHRFGDLFVSVFVGDFHS